MATSAIPWLELGDSLARSSPSLDALTSIVCEDDSQIVELTITRHQDEARPRVELTLTPVT